MEILIAIISAAGTVCGSLGGILISNRISTYRIGELEKKVEKHNNLIDRVYRLEEHDAVMDEEIKVANHRISDLEQSCNK